MIAEGEQCSGSRFLITYAVLPHLNGQNTIFGQLTKGKDILEALADMGTDRAGKVEFIGYIVVEKIEIM